MAQFIEEWVAETIRNKWEAEAGIDFPEYDDDDYDDLGVPYWGDEDEDEDDEDGEPYEDSALADSETLNSVGWGEWD